uniref:Nucleoprotein TPR/MLP1-2 domain-containing protein n=1 Tax=Tetraodon nigroviridis TaxID=99883 RepID=H3CJ19_TETNG
MKQQEQETRRRAIDELEKHVSDLQRSLKASQAKEQEALERTAAAVTLEQKAIQDSLLQTKLAAEAQAKYERELMLHAADVEAIQELKKKAEEEAVKKKELEIQVAKASSVLQEKVAAWNLVERQLKEDLSNKSKQCALGERERNVETSRESAHSGKLLTTPTQISDKSYIRCTSDRGGSSARLIEQVHLLRRKMTVERSELETCQRLNKKIDQLEAELVSAKTKLDPEDEKDKATTRTLAAQERQLKKIEDIKVLQETNRMLKMDKEKLEQELLQTQARVTKLQSDISPLHHSMSILSEKIGSLQADKKLLEEDLKRWKTKTQQLISQQKESETEERQKIASERRDQQRNISQLVEETTNLKNELARSTASCNSAQSQLQNLRDSVTHLTAERDALKKDLETKNNDILEKNKTITQVKKIGRRYKSQYEELKIQHDKAKEALQRSLDAQKELQQSHSQEVTNLKAAVSQAEIKVTKLQEDLDSLQKIVDKRETDVKRLQEQASQAQEELVKLRQELCDGKNREEQLKKQIAEKDEKTKKVFLGAKTKISQLSNAKVQLSQEMEELKQSKKELEVRMNALKSQYEGRLHRLERELRELRDARSHHSELSEEPQDQVGVKAGEQTRSSEQRKISLKSPAHDRGSSSLSEPPTANIRPTPSTQSPGSKSSPSPGSKATPRASIRPMVTPTVPVPTPTATVMPTTQAESQEVRQRVISFLFAVVINSGPSGSTQLPAITAPSSIQTTAFVQPTQQQVGFSVDMEQPSTSSFIGPGSPLDSMKHILVALYFLIPLTIRALCLTTQTGSKRGREEDGEDNRPESLQTTTTVKKSRIDPAPSLQVNILLCRCSSLLNKTEPEEIEEMDDNREQELSQESYSSLNEDEESIEQDGTSQSVPSDPLSSQNFIIAETDSSSCESKLREKHPNICEEAQQEEDGDEEIKAEEMCEVDNAGDRGTRRSEDGHIASKQSSEEGREGKHADTPHTEDTSDPGRPSEEAPSGEGTSSAAASESSLRKDPAHLVLSSSPSTISSSSPSLPQPRRTSHPLPPRLYIQPPPPELHFQRHPLPLPRPSGGRGPQLTPGVGSMQQHFFDDEDRMVPSTPTLVVPHRTDGFAEAIHSPQVAGLSTSFRFGLPDDVLSQASASHSDLGQLASQGGLGMYESPLFLAAHDEDGGGRSVPTTPLQLAAPVTVFTESLPSDGAESVTSQSVPMVSAAAGVAAAADERDEAFAEQDEEEGTAVVSSAETAAEPEPAGTSAQQEDASQDPDNSSVAQQQASNSQPPVSSLSGRGGRREARTPLTRRGAYSRGGRGGTLGRGGVV